MTSDYFWVIFDYPFVSLFSAPNPFGRDVIYVQSLFDKKNGKEFDLR